VFNDDYKTVQRMLPMLQRVMVVHPKPAGARLVCDLMRTIARSEIYIASSLAEGMGTAAAVDPQIIFVEMSETGFDGCEFTRTLRRSNLACRQTPVIMLASAVTAASILAARDAGVHEFLRKPFTTRDLLRRLEAVTLRPRDWIEAVIYVGPDRRRFNSGDYQGPLKRRSDTRATPESARILQALKILKAAVDAVGHDPVQAMRSMQAQTSELQRAALAVSDVELSCAASDFQRYLAGAAQPLVASGVAAAAAPLLALTPPDDGLDVDTGAEIVAA
jgi:two-component system, response regulator PdtaR